MDSCLGHIFESTNVIDIKLGFYIDSSERKGSAQEPYSYSVYLQSYLPLTIFHSGCLSGPYLGKYKRYGNETWFIDR